VGRAGRKFLLLPWPRRLKRRIGVVAHMSRTGRDHLIVHEEAWPKLTVETRAATIWTQDGIDVYAEAGGREAVHAGQNFMIDPST
jgi:hypothetical protein